MPALVFGPISRLLRHVHGMSSHNQQGNAAAQCNLGKMYESGQGGYSCTVTGRRLSLETLSISSL